MANRRTISDPGGNDCKADNGAEWPPFGSDTRSLNNGPWGFAGRLLEAGATGCDMEDDSEGCHSLVTAATATAVVGLVEGYSQCHCPAVADGAAPRHNQCCADLAPAQGGEGAPHQGTPAEGLQTRQLTRPPFANNGICCEGWDFRLPSPKNTETWSSEEEGNCHGNFHRVWESVA